MIEDWKIEIGKTWLVKQRMMELDHKHIFPYHLPEVAATEEEIRTAEQHLGHSLDPKYREFLRFANGWPAFWQSTDLFGTHDLISGLRKETGQFQLSMLSDDVLHSSDLSRADLLPIAATSVDRDLFVIMRPHAKTPGGIVWFAGEEVERFKSFDDFFLSMLELSREDLAWFQEKQNVKKNDP